jgi:hypothetical protein
LTSSHLPEAAALRWWDADGILKRDASERSRPMQRQPEQTESDETKAASGSFDGQGGGDHDQPYAFGRRPNTASTFPFSTREYARLLIVRGRVHAARAA